jgi:hypothetical protein
MDAVRRTWLGFGLVRLQFDSDTSGASILCRIARFCEESEVGKQESRQKILIADAHL